VKWVEININAILHYSIINFGHSDLSAQFLCSQNASMKQQICKDQPSTNCVEQNEKKEKMHNKYQITRTVPNFVNSSFMSSLRIIS
jgi:hypothetical protein